MNMAKLCGLWVLVIVVLLVVEGQANEDKQKRKNKRKKQPEPDFIRMPIREGRITLKALKYNRQNKAVSNIPIVIEQNERNDMLRTVQEKLRNVIPDEVVRNFDDDVAMVADAMARRLGSLNSAAPKVVSVNGSDSSLPHRIFNKYKVKSEVVSQHTRDSNFSPVKPTTLVTKWVHNHLLANNTESVISEEVTRKTSTSTSMTKTVGGSVTASMSINFWVASASASVSVGGSFSTTSTTEQEDVKTFMLQDTITVNPKSSAKVVWNVMERTLKLTWDADLKIKGYFALETNKAELYFVPVTIMPYFFNEYELTNITDLIVTTISGTMKSQEGTESTVTTLEFPLQVGNRNIDKCNDGIPLDKAIKGKQG